MKIISVRLSLNGATTKQLNSLFSLIQRYESPITISRVVAENLSYAGSDLILDGVFNSVFVKKLANIFPYPVEVAYDISEHKDFLHLLENYATMKWELSQTVFLGITLFPTEVMKKFIDSKNNDEFLRLILTTPLGSYLKSMLILKPKGLLAISENKMHLFLLNQRFDFVSIWLDWILNKNTVDLNWVSGDSGKLQEDYHQTVELPVKIQTDLNKWREVIKDRKIEDFGLVYGRLLKLLARG